MPESARSHIQALRRENIRKHLRSFGLTTILRRRRLTPLVTAGDAANAARRWAEAEAAYAAALDIDPSLSDIWVQYGHALKQQGFLPEAEASYRRALELDNASWDKHLQLGHVLKLQGRIDDAITSYRAAYLRNPESPHPRLELVTLGAGLPDAAVVAALRGSTSLADAPGGVRPSPRPSPGTPPAGCGAADLDNLLRAHGLAPDFCAIFDPGFYYHQNAEVRRAVAAPDRYACIRHFCEAGVTALLAVSEHHTFDPEFYCETYLGTLPFTSVNAYRHWLNTGLHQGSMPNRRAWIRSLFGKDVEGADAIDVAGVSGAGAGEGSWASQFERFANGGAAATALPVTDAILPTLVAIADRHGGNGQDDQAFALYQRILRHRPEPDYPSVMRHYADVLLRRNCPLEAMAVYRRILDGDRHTHPWVFINLARCHEELGETEMALAVLRQSARVYPSDLNLRRKFDELARRFSSREWDGALAMGRRGEFEAAQARLARACDTLSAHVAVSEQLPSRPIRAVALVVNLDLPQCQFYRVDQKVEQLKLAGFEVAVFEFRHEIPRFLAEVHKFEAAVFYLLPALYDVIVAIRKAQELGLATFYEIDDLIFDAATYPASLASYGDQISNDEYIGLKLGVPLFAHAMSLCVSGIASTPALAEQMRPRVASGTVFVHRNAFGSKHEAHAARTPDSWRDERARQARPGERVTIFYGSGTKAHKTDFQELVEPALVELVRRHGERIAIVLMGHIPMTDRLRAIEANLTVLAPIWNIDEYWALLSLMDINIAVLKPSLMTDCKSEIKWLEAAMFAIPSVVSDTATFREVISPGRTGLLCATAAEWTSALDRLVRDSKLRLCIGRQAREQARASYGMAVMADNLRAILGGPAQAASADTRPTILIVNVFYPPLAIGGATRVVHDNVRRLAKAYGDRFRLEVFTSLEGGEEPYQLSSYVLDGLRVTGVTTPVDPQAETAASNERMGEIFGRFLDRVAPSLVHFHCVQRLTGSIVSATLERGIPYLVSVHDGWWISDTQFLLDADGQIRVYDYADPLATMRKLGRPAFDRLMRLRRPLLGAARVLAVSAPFAEIYRGCGVGNVATVANGVSTLPPPVRVASPDGRVRLGFISGMATHKGYPLIKYALRGQRLRNLRLLVIDHAMEPGESRREMWGETEVTFRPKCPQDRIVELYGEIDVLLAPSMWPESYGLVTREALQCGCWVVASDRGSVGEYVIDGHNGFIIDVVGPADLVDALARIDADPLRYLAPPAGPPAMRRSSDQADELATLYKDLLAAAATPEAGASGQRPGARVPA